MSVWQQVGISSEHLELEWQFHFTWNQWFEKCLVFLLSVGFFLVFFSLFFCSAIWHWLSCKCEHVSGKHWMPANTKYVFLSELVIITCICLRKCAICKCFQSLCFCDVSGRCHFCSSWYFLYFPHQKWPVVAAWEVSSNYVKSIIV